LPLSFRLAAPILIALAAPGLAQAASVRIEEAKIAGLLVKGVEIEGGALDQAAADRIFSFEDDTEAFTGLVAERVRIENATTISFDNAPTLELGGVELRGIDKGSARRITIKRGAARIGQAAGGPITFVEASAGNLSFGSIALGMARASLGAMDILRLRFDDIAVREIDAPTASVGLAIPEGGLRIVGAEVRAEYGSGDVPKRKSLVFSISPRGGAVDVEERQDVKLTLVFDDKTSRLELEEFRFSSPRLGAVALTAQLNGVTASALTGADSDMLSAWLGVRMARAALKAEDRGLVLAAFSRIGERQGKDAATAKAEAAELSRIAIGALLADRPDARALGAALADFINGSGRLEIEASAPNGVGFADVIAAERPSDLLASFEFTAKTTPH
jgi:hypothetical protein